MLSVLIPVIFIFVALVSIFLTSRKIVNNQKNEFKRLESTFNKNIKINKVVNDNEIEIVIFQYKLLDQNHAAISVVNKTTNTNLITNINIINKFYNETTKEYLIFSKNINQQDNTTGTTILNFNLDLWLNKDQCIRYEISSV
jgi:hypothetical protein